MTHHLQLLVTRLGLCFLIFKKVLVRYCEQCCKEYWGCIDGAGRPAGWQIREQADSGHPRRCREPSQRPAPGARTGAHPARLPSAPSASSAAFRPAAVFSCFCISYPSSAPGPEVSPHFPVSLPPTSRPSAPLLPPPSP